jgi:hypothetical protein
VSPYVYDAKYHKDVYVPTIAEQFVEENVALTKNTIISNVSLIGNGGYTVPLGKTLVITGSFSAPLKQVFFGSGSVVFSTGMTVYPEWWGAVSDGTTDCRSSLQAAIACALVNGGTVKLSSGKYLVKTTGLSVNNSGTKGFAMVGAGQYATIILTPKTGDDGAMASGNLISWVCNGPSSTLKDLMISADTGGNSNIVALSLATCNGVTLNNLWLSSCQTGLKISESSNIRVSNIQSELNTVNFWNYKSYMVVYTNYHSYRATSTGFYLTGNDTPATNLISGGVVMNGGSFVEDGYGGDGSGGAVVVDTLIPVSINGIEICSAGDAVPIRGIYVLTGNVYVSNPLISHCKNYGVQIQDGNLTIQGGMIRKIGYFDQTTPWATYGVYAGENASSLIVMGTEINSEGWAIFTQAVNNELIGVSTKDCCGGGSTGSVNATTGNATIEFDPQSEARHFKMVGCQMYNASGTGKTGLKINSDATPSGGNIKLIGNNVAAASFDTPFSSTLTNAQLLTYEYSRNSGLIKTSNSGLSSIASGTVAVAVTHGLGLTPGTQHIMITGQENPTNPVGTIFVDNMNATTFQVNVENDPGSSNWDFGWSVDIK